jgi:hypothetical protein
MQGAEKGRFGPFFSDLLHQYWPRLRRGRIKIQQALKNAVPFLSSLPGNAADLRC